MLGLDLNEARVSTGMITTSETVPGYEIIATLGIVEGVAEGSFAAMSVGGLGLERGGELDRLLDEAKEKLALIAGAMGANAIIGFRYETMGRHVEKSAVTYRTAVKCLGTEKQSGPTPQDRPTFS